MNGNLPAVVKAAISEQRVNLDQVNLMLPTQTFGEVLGMYDKVTIEVVTIDASKNAGEVFEIGGKKSLGRVPLEKISSAVGIIWDPVHTTILESTSTKSRAKATGALRKPNGEFIVLSEEKTVDLEAIEAEQLLKSEDDAKRGKIVEVNGQIQWEHTQEGKASFRLILHSRVVEGLRAEVFRPRCLYHRFQYLEDGHQVVNSAYVS